MAGRTLAVNTTVDGVTYEAGSVPDAAVAKLITNPKAWGDESSGEGAEPKGSAKKAAPKKAAASK